MKKILLLVLCIVSLAFAVGTPVGGTVANMSWTDSNGENHSFDELLNNGKVVYIFIGHDWCGPCCASAPHMNDFWEANKNNNNLYVLSLTDWNTVPSVANSYSGTFTMPVWGGLENVQSNFTYNNGVPSFCVIGYQREVFHGSNSWSGAAGAYQAAVNSLPTGGHIIVDNEVPGLDMNKNSTSNIDISNVFSHSDNDPFTVTASSSSSYTVSTQLSGNTLKLSSGYSSGSAEITLTATSNKSSASTTFKVFVKNSNDPSLVKQDFNGELSHAVPSQNFETEYDDYDCWAADDFVIPAGKTWTINEILVYANYSDSDKDDFTTFTVEIYSNSNNKPGDVVFTEENITAKMGAENSYYLTISNELELSSGTYWLMVQNQNAYGDCGQWYWAVKDNPVIGSEYVFKRPGGDNPDWTYASSLNYDGVDFGFSLNGHESSVGINDLNVDNASLLSNYPNPFNPSTVIEYSVNKMQNVSLNVFNAKGEKVASLVNGVKSKGLHSVNFDASNLNSGIYFCKLKLGNKVLTSKMVLTK